MTTVIPFSRYNEEFSSLVTQTRQTLSSITSILQSNDYDNVNDDEENNNSNTTSPTGADLKSTLQQKVNLSNQLLAQTKDLLKQMTIESRSLSSSSTTHEDVNECKKILQIAKANHANLKDDVSSISNQVNHYLLTTTSTSTSSSSSSKRNNKQSKKSNSINPEIKEHLLSTTNTLSNTSSTISNSRQIMADTELIAMEITEELARNRETIESAHSRVRGVSSLSNQARRILVNMNRREVQQKMVVYIVGFVLVLALLFLGGFF